jgi:hypothetical protein
VPRTAQEQGEQVAHYAEILEAQQTAKAERSALVEDVVVGSLIVTGLIVGALFLIEDSAVLVIAFASSLLTSLVTGSLLFRRQGRRRRAAERLSSLREKGSTQADYLAEQVGRRSRNS